jgi:hypothetical protein
LRTGSQEALSGARAILGLGGSVDACIPIALLVARFPVI